MNRRRSKPDLTAEDRALFREAIGAVERLPEASPRPKPAPPPPRAGSRERDEAEALRQSREAPFQAVPFGPGDALQYLAAGQPARLLRRLKRGQYAVQDELDLHRLTRAQAEPVLREFLREARREGRRCVRIVHGKGLGSDNGMPVLKAIVDQMLRHRAEVLAFASAPAGGGGTGAVLVLLDRA